MNLIEMMVPEINAPGMKEFLGYFRVVAAPVSIIREAWPIIVNFITISAVTDLERHQSGEQ